MVRAWGINPTKQKSARLYEVIYEQKITATYMDLTVWEKNKTWNRSSDFSGNKLI